MAMLLQDFNTRSATNRPKNIKGPHFEYMDITYDHAGSLIKFYSRNIGREYTLSWRTRIRIFLACKFAPRFHSKMPFSNPGSMSTFPSQNSWKYLQQPPLWTCPRCWHPSQLIATQVNDGSSSNIHSVRTPLYIELGVVRTTNVPHKCSIASSLLGSNRFVVALCTLLLRIHPMIMKTQIHYQPSTEPNPGLPPVPYMPELWSDR